LCGGSILKFSAEAAQIDLKEVQIGHASFFFVVGGQLVDGVQCGEHLVFPVKFVVAVLNQLVLGQAVDILADGCGVFRGLVGVIHGYVSFLRPYWARSKSHRRDAVGGSTMHIRQQHMVDYLQDVQRDALAMLQGRFDAGDILRAGCIVVVRFPATRAVGVSLHVITSKKR
jgi:hypothetical protein